MVLPFATLFGLSGSLEGHRRSCLLVRRSSRILGRIGLGLYSRSGDYARAASVRTGTDDGPRTVLVAT